MSLARPALRTAAAVAARLASVVVAVVLAAVLFSSPPLAGATLTLVSPSSCSSTQYYSISQLTCMSCGSNMEQDGYGTGCRCMYGYYGTTSCTACAANKATTQDRSQCLACDGVTATYSSVISDCACVTSTDVLVEKDQTGTFLATKECLTCPSTSVLSARYFCIACTDTNMVGTSGTCACSASYTQYGQSCVLSTYSSSLISSYSGYSSITYRNYVDGSAANSLTSSVLSSYVIPSAYFCNTQTTTTSNTSVNTWCQELGNLCVLQQYTTTTAACAYFKIAMQSLSSVDSTNFPGWKTSLPWLYYDVSSASAVLSSTSTITGEPVLSYQSGKLYNMLFYVFEYMLNGTLKSTYTLQEQLNLCGSVDNTLGASNYYLTFGYNYQISCNIPYANFWKLNNTLLDIWFSDSDGSLKPVPIIVSTMTDASGNLINSGSVNTLVRRLFLFDNQTGVTSTSTQPQVAVVASSISLIFQKVENQQVLQPPRIQVSYSTVPLSLLTSSGSFPFSFTAKYYSDLSSFWSDMLILIIIVTVAAGVWAIVQLWGWMRRNQHDEIDASMAAQAISCLVGCIGDMYFWMSWLVCCYWFIFFKSERQAKVLLPLDSDASTLLVIIYVAFACKVVRLLDRLHTQANISIFFIDWEKSRGKLLGQQTYAPVSFWRTIFIASEWNRLANMPVVNLAVSLLWLLFFLGGLNWYYLSTAQPNIHDTSATAPLSQVLQWSVAIAIWLVAVISQWLCVTVYRRFFGHPSLQFIDKCSLANVSVFVLINKFYGYYIHGRSSHSYADTTMTDIAEQLKREELNTVAHRGLESHKNTQVFELMIHKELRTKIENIYLAYLQKEEEISASQSGRLTWLQGRSAATPPSQRLIKAYAHLNHFLSNFVNEQTEFYRRIRPREIVHSVFDIPPDLNDLQGGDQKFCLFIEDDSVFGVPDSFHSVLLRGVEYDVTITMMLLFGILDLNIRNPYIPALIVGVVWYLVCAVRAYFFQNNVAAKTLVSDKLLIGSL
eukprot:gnl/Spiro4/6408_TR3288_c0_g1_i1.p1 gnl/Spiro4/6408_TR3288_c0_g1~~gnl/Spiro4/6408_TR3288_c0_g1_i1.p1  ORF type:complete len:1031 (-),score=347.92 gnl/Spiro4/6408_TR3288_c0_g1_i1:172-3186(-)